MFYGRNACTREGERMLRNGARMHCNKAGAGCSGHALLGWSCRVIASEMALTQWIGLRPIAMTSSLAPMADSLTGAIGGVIQAY